VVPRRLGSLGSERPTPHAARRSVAPVTADKRCEPSMENPRRAPRCLH
jgi:hypothetical protein